MTNNIPQGNTFMVQNPPENSVLEVHKVQNSKWISNSTKLKVQVLVTFFSGATQSLEALVDTGAEVSLIHPKWVPATDFF